MAIFGWVCRIPSSTLLGGGHCGNESLSTRLLGKSQIGAERLFGQMGVCEARTPPKRFVVCWLASNHPNSLTILLSSRNTLPNVLLATCMLVFRKGLFMLVSRKILFAILIGCPGFRRSLASGLGGQHHFPPSAELLRSVVPPSFGEAAGQGQGHAWRSGWGLLWG